MTDHSTMQFRVAGGRDGNQVLHPGRYLKRKLKFQVTAQRETAGSDQVTTPG